MTCEELILQMTWKSHVNCFTQVVWILLQSSVLGHQVWYSLENGKGSPAKGTEKRFFWWGKSKVHNSSIRPVQQNQAQVRIFIAGREKPDFLTFVS